MIPKLIPPSAEELRAFIFSLITLVEAEALAEQATNSHLFASLSTKELERSGLSLGGLTVGKTSIGLGGKRLVEISKSFAIHSRDGETGWGENGFRAGDVVELAPHSGTSKIKIEGVVHRVFPEKMVIAIKSSNGATKATGEKGDVVEKAVEEVELPDLIRISKLSNPATSLRQIGALRDLLTKVLPKTLPIPSSSPPVSSTTPIDPVSPIDSTELPPPSLLSSTPPPYEVSSTLSPLISVLLGLSSPSKPPPSNSKPIKYFNESLNESQREAIRFILEDCAEVGTIWGPPGTGKTASLVEIVLQILAKKPIESSEIEGEVLEVKPMRILICGASNLAVDNLMERLSILIPSKLVRIGHPSRVLDNLIGFTLDVKTEEVADGVIKGIKLEIESNFKELGKGKMRGKDRRAVYDSISHLKKEFRKREGNVLKEVLNQSQVVLTTLHGAGNWALAKEKEWDWVIIDEAAQATEASCWIPILKAKRLILAGDHLQLPPTIISDDSHRSQKKSNGKVAPEKKKAKGKTSASAITSVKPEATETTAISPPASLPLSTATFSPPSSLQPTKTQEFTLFSRLLALHGKRIQRMLQVQYRMAAPICKFPSLAMYENSLEPHPSISNIKLTDLEGVSGDEDELENLIFYDTAGSGMMERIEEGKSGSKCNENEGVLVEKQVVLLIEAGVKEEDIAIISPYIFQISSIARLLARFPGLQIGSIDSFQGREAEVVIVSLVRSNEQREVGFLKESRRLNVAMTRAKRQLCVIGDSDTIKTGSSYLKKWMEFLEEEALVLGVE